MATPAQLRALSLSLPDTEEKSHFGKADFRVRNKIFAGFSEEPRRGYFKARPELQEELAAASSSAFAPAPGGWGKSGWTYVELPKVELTVLRELIIDAWKLVAPAKLVAAYESGSAPKPAGRSAAVPARASSTGMSARPRTRSRAKRES
jgi:predicted DNA-binding protein (MmcQ/YjbR family)